MYATHISIPLGIFIGLLASFVQSLGLTIQRKSHVLNQLLPSHQQRVEHRRPLWLLGFAIFISSNILGSLVQIASLPVVILAPLGAVSLLWNAFFARLILGDVFSPWMILGTVLIAGGAVLIAVFGVVPEPTRSLEDLLELFKRPVFVTYFSILGAIVFICLIITHVIDYSFSQHLPQMVSPPVTPVSDSSISISKPSVLTMGMATPIANTVTSTERTPLLDPKLTQASSSSSPSKTSLNLEVYAINRTRLLLAVSYASFSGIISGMCLLFAKSGVELLLLTFRGQNQFWRWQAWVLVFGLAAFAFLQLWYLHKALILADPTLVCPSAFCFYNLSSIVNGLVYFNQFSLIPAWHLVLVVLGIAVLLGGVWVVSIKSGSGEIDPESWNDELETEDDFVHPGARTINAEVMDDHVAHTSRVADCGWNIANRRPRFEPDVHVLSASPESTENVSEFRSSFRPHSAVSEPLPQQLATPLVEPESSINDSSQRISSTYVRPHRRRPTLDISHRSRHGHIQTIPLNYSHSGHVQIPSAGLPLHSVSTLGAGLQVGLSPVSPGFAIVPRERGRRLSGLGLGAGSGLADVVFDTASHEHREAERRRTVSEGDVRQRASAMASDQSVLPKHGSSTNVITREIGSSHSAAKRKGKDREDGAEGKWRWLRKIFM